MRITCIDEPTYLSDEFVSWMESIGEFVVYDDRPDPDTAIARLSNTDLAIVEWTGLTADVFASVSRVRYLTLVTSSFDFVDVHAASAAGVTVAYCPDYAARAVAEHVFALLLAVGRRLLSADAAVRAGASHCYPPFLGIELHGRTLGLVGTGRIARLVATIAHGFGMRVIAANRRGIGIPGVTLMPLDDVLRASDVVSVHVPMDARTQCLLDADRLRLLKPSAIVINTSRGGVIDQPALGDALATGRLAGAGLDDLVEAGAARLRGLDSVVLTPGIGWYTDVARTSNLVEVRANIASYLAGAPANTLA